MTAGTLGSAAIAWNSGSRRERRPGLETAPAVAQIAVGVDDEAAGERDGLRSGYERLLMT